jgi:hypothetical protein
MTMKHDIVGLEKKLRTIQKGMADLGGQKLSDEFIQIIHRPGWTTPAEFMLVSAMADSLQKQIDTASAHCKQLVEATSRIGKE